MPCKTSKNSQHGVTRGKSNENPQDCVWQNLYWIIMKTILQERGTIPCNIIIWYTNSFLCLKPWRFPQQRQQWIRNGKIRKIPAWNLTQVRSKKEVIDEARTKGAKVHFASLMDICHLKNAELEAKHQKFQRSSCIPWWYCKRQFWVLRSIHRTRSISISNDSRQDHGYHLQSAWVRRTSSWCSICLYPCKNEDAAKLLKIPKSECLDIWIRLRRHKWPKLWSSMEDPVVLLERNLYGHPLAGQLWRRQFEIELFIHGWEKVPNWECLFVNREKELLLSVICGR